MVRYDGRLLNAFEAEPGEAAGELISLFRVNTHFCVVMDSGIKEQGAPISATTARIVDECAKSHCMSWVTHGKTIENYIPKQELEWAIREVHGDAVYDGKLEDRYAGPLDSNFHGVKTRPDKIRIARAIVRRGHDMGEGLQGKVRELADDIRRVNGLLNAGARGSR